MRKVERSHRNINKNLSQKLKLSFWTLFGIIALYYLSFNDYGIVHHFRIKKELKQIQVQIEKLETQQKDIKVTIGKLKTNYDYIEKLAREKFRLVKEGEELYIIKKNPNDLKPKK